MDRVIADNTTTSAVAAFIQRRIGNKLDTTRSNALQSFQQSGLPAPKNEEYKHTPLARALEKNFAFGDQKSPSTITDVGEFRTPGVDANLIVFINGSYAPALSHVLTAPEKITITSLEDALAAKNVAANAHYGQYANPKADAFVAWNTAAWKNGLFIQVPDNTTVEEPVEVLYINDALAGEVVAENRNLILVGKNSQMTIIEKFHSVGEGNHFTNLVNEVFVAEDARFEYYTISNDKGNRYQFSHTEIHQEDTSRVNTYTFDLQGRLLRTNLHLIIDGEDIESHMYGLYLLQGNTLADNHTVVDHKKPNSLTNELYKGIMNDSSKGVFNGKIFVRPHAQKTNAFQSNRNILLSEKAAANTKPQLEIWADDVKCSHGCTIGQLDEEALFYLRARGIDKHTARAMMLYAFAAEVSDHIPHAAIREHIEAMIRERLQTKV